MRSRLALAIVVAVSFSAAVASAQNAKVAELIKALEGSDMAARQQAADALGDHGLDAKVAVPALAKALSDSNADLRYHAVRSLASLGPAAKDAVPQLIKVLKDEDVRVKGHAVFALGKIGPPAAGAANDLALLIEDPSADIRRAVVSALHEIKPGAKVLAPVLAKAIKDKDRSVAVPASHYLAETGEACVSLMIEALAHEDSQAWACIVLSEIGPAAKAAVPALEKTLSDPDAEVRLHAAIALGEIGPAAMPAAKQLLAAAEDAEPAVRHGAIYALGKIGVKEATPVLEKHLASDKPFVQMMAAWALAKIHPDNAEQVNRAIELILKSLQSKDADTRRGAARALVELKAPPDKVGPALAEALNSASPDVVENAIAAYASLGPKAAAGAARALGRKEVREYGMEVLRRLGPDAVDAIPALITALKDEDPVFRREAAFVLAGIGPNAKDAVPALVAALSDPSGEFRPAVCFALGRIGPAAKEAVPQLRKNLLGEDRLLKFASVWALLKILPDDGPQRPLAVPILASMLEKAPHDFIRIQAALALGELGSAAKAAAPMLQKLSDDPNPAVRQAAADALKQISP